MRENLEIFEIKKGLKAKEIAKMTGITEQTYCNIKKGKTNPSIEYAYKFNEVFPDANVLELFKIVKEK